MVGRLEVVLAALVCASGIGCCNRRGSGGEGLRGVVLSAGRVMLDGGIKYPKREVEI